MEFITELKKLGLKDKEASVYLACLILGPSPVQVIARKAKVVRATTYVILEALVKLGLVTEYKVGKKTLFVAEPPRQLTRLIEKQQEEINEKKEELLELLPELQMVTKAEGGKPQVRYFEGLEGLRAMRQEMVMYSRSSDVWYNFTPIDHLNAVFGREDLTYARQRTAKSIKGKSLITTKSKKLKEELLSQHDPYSERRFIKPELFPSSSGMTIFRDRIAIGTFSGKVGGVIVESQSMADMMRQIFDLAWLSAETLDKKISST
jgi:sugar-specific transcriptional regulator TrmB